MATYNDTQHVKEAVETRSKFDLSHDVITTSDFNVLNVVSIREMIPSDSFHVNVNSFARLAPLPAPTYGRSSMVNRAFFVPLRILMPGWKEFMDGTKLNTGGYPIDPTIPVISNLALFAAFKDPTSGFTNITDGNSAYQWFDNDKFYVLTPRGRRLYSLLVSLGYQLNPGHEDNTLMSLLPLFAYCKIYTDWYQNMQYQTLDPINSYLSDSNIRITTKADAIRFLSIIPFFGLLEKDYFSNAWINPGNNYGLSSMSLSNSLFGEGSSIYKDLYITSNGRSLNVPAIATSGDQVAISSISQYGLDTLHAMDHYLKRNMIAGNRYVEQMLARFGIRVPDAWLNRAEYIGSSSAPVMISDVMSTSETQAVNLGDYAGKGITSDNGSFSYDSKEFGYFIVLNQLIPHTGYVQGRRRETVFHIDKLDFFTPEFETVGTAPIRNDELYAQFQRDDILTETQESGGKPDGIFGFQDRYGEYRNSFDVLSGDFINRSVNRTMGYWHLFRDMDPENQNLALNAAFNSGDPNDVRNNFNRIFQDTTARADHFIMVHNVRISAYRPIRSGADVLVTEGGKDVTLSRGGYQL